MFFANYVYEFSQTWDILLKYHNAVDVPEHLTLSLDAVSLAFMAHNTHSTEANDLSRKKYVSALRMINTELQRADSVKKASTFEGALLLDLFEKMTKSVTEDNVPHHAHVEGALALAKLRGVETFQEGYELKSLLGLSLNATICCLTTTQKISEPIRMIREHAAKSIDVTNLNWKLSDVLMDIVDLVADIRTNTMTLEEKTARCTKLDNCLETISQEATPAWSYERVIVPVEHRRGLLPDDSPPLYDKYPSRAVIQTWNVLRLLRILLYEELISHCLTPSYVANLFQPPTFTTPTIQQICASVPHMTDCSLVASSKLPPDSPCQHSHPSSSGPSHTIPHVLDAYILIFPLYVVAWSRYCSMPTRAWVLDQLNHIATHFGIHEADIVRDILLREADTGGAENPWYVLFRTLGAFDSLCQGL